MTLIDRYVHAVRSRLPRKERDDIAAELRDSLLSQIEAEQTGRGRHLADDEIVAILKTYGSPDAVAARYGARAHLIGPDVFPHYVFVVKLVFWIIVPLMLIGVGTAAFSEDDAFGHAMRALWQLSSVVLLNLALVTLVGFYEGAGLLLEMAILVLLYQLLRAPALIVVTDPTAAGAPFVGCTNVAISAGLVIWFVAALISAGFTARRFFSIAWRGHHPVATSSGH